MTEQAKIIGIVNQKGGVGKTTTAINIAHAFALMGKKTLLVDLDPQGNASTGLGISDREKNIYGVLLGEYKASEAIMPSKSDNLHVISSNVDLSACEVEFTQIDGREFLLKAALQDVIEDFDYIIIDCPPSLGLLTVNVLAAVDSILVPMQCEFFALEGLSHLLTTLELVTQNINPNLTIGGIVLAMYDSRNNLNGQVEDDVRDFLGDKVFKTVIPRNIKLSEAPSYGISALKYAPYCTGSLAYLQLANEILEKDEIYQVNNNGIKKYA